MRKAKTKAKPQAAIGRVKLSSKGPAYRLGGDNAKCRTQLHRDFEGRCAYCLWHVEQSCSEFEIDHFNPRSRRGSNKYPNLRLSCSPCNVAKGNLPTPAQRAKGLHILDPCAVWDYGDHLVEQADGTLTTLTPEGEFHCRRLHLNRPKLVTARKKRDAKRVLCDELDGVIRTLADQDMNRIRLLGVLKEARRELTTMLPFWSDLIRRRPKSSSAASSPRP